MIVKVLNVTIGHWPPWQIGNIPLSDLPRNIRRQGETMEGKVDSQVVLHFCSTIQNTYVYFSNIFSLWISWAEEPQPLHILRHEDHKPGLPLWRAWKVWGDGAQAKVVKVFMWQISRDYSQIIKKSIDVCRVSLHAFPFLAFVGWFAKGPPTGP